MSLSIFNYQEPARYLRDAWESKRQTNKNFTVRSWANQIGISSHGTFYQIIQGKRPLPKKYVQPLSRSLKLTPKESLYLETLIDYNSAKSLSIRSYYSDRLKELAPGEKLSIHEIESFNYLKNPINGAIIELTNLKDFKFNSFWIKERLQVKASINEIEKAITLLLDLNLLRKDAKGSIKRVHKHINTRQDIRSEALQEYHKNVLALAIDEVTNQDIEQREYNATALGIRLKDMPKIKEDIRSFVEEFIRKYEATEGEAEEIYQLGIQFFGLTNKKEKLS